MSSSPLHGIWPDIQPTAMSLSEDHCWARSGSVAAFEPTKETKNNIFANPKAPMIDTPLLQNLAPEQGQDKIPN